MEHSQSIAMVQKSIVYKHENKNRYALGRKTTVIRTDSKLIFSKSPLKMQAHTRKTRGDEYA